MLFAILPAGQSAEPRQSEDTAQNANGQRKEFITGLKEIKGSPDECYDTLKRRLLEGHFDDVKAALDLRDDQGRRIFGGYRFAQLRALCARMTFQRYHFRTAQLGWPTEKEGERLRQLAGETTAAYEEAFRLAPSDYERACIYARWHEVHTHRRFETDSLLLRSGSPLEYLDKPVDEVFLSQVLRLRSKATQALSSAKAYDKPLTADQSEAFLNVLTDEYRKLGRMGVPQKIFQEVLEDLPDFLQKAIHPRLLTHPHEKQMTIRYHLWYALTGPRPDRIDQDFISQQLQTVNRYIGEGFTGRLPAWYAEETSKYFVERAGLVRGNCFIPRLKQPIWPFEWSEPSNKYQKSIEGRILDQIGKTVRQKLEHDRITASFSASRRSAEDMREHIAVTTSQIAVVLMSDLSIYQRLGHFRYPPGVWIASSGGTTHDQSGVWVHTIGKYQPLPSYPWKKTITPMDSSTASTRSIASRVLKAIAAGDTATLDTLVSESRDFSKQDIHKLTVFLNDEIYATEPERMQEIEDLLIEKPWSWSVVSVRRPSEAAEKTLALILRWKLGGYWLVWAGLIEGTEQESLSDMLARLKPGLELPPEPAPVEIAKPVDILSVDGISEMQSLDPIDAGHSWRVRLALAEGDAAVPWKLLYCRAEWTDQDRPARPVPYGRYIARHLGPVVWTINKEGFHEAGPDLNSRPAPPMSIEGNGSVYAATLPLRGFEQSYLQVYSAFDGRELARRRITADESSVWSWGRFMAHRKGSPFGVSADFDAACPGMPAFKPVLAKTMNKGVHSISLSVEDGFFSLKSDKRILPTRGSRLLARWWLNGEPVSPQTAGEFAAVNNAHTEGLASLLRMPAKLPTAVLKAKPGDKVGLQVMLSPDRIESPALNPESSQCITSLDIGKSPTVPILTNRLDFKVNAAMIAESNSKPVTAANLKKLAEAIRKGNTRTVRRLLSECPQLARARDSSGQSALEILCCSRPMAKYIWRWKIGGDATVKYWKDMAEIAGILIDYGAEVNVKTPTEETPLYYVIDRGRSFGPDDTPPVELVRTLLDRGADPEIGGHRGTVLQRTVTVLLSYQSKIMAPVVEILLAYGADVYATGRRHHEKPAYELIDELRKKGNIDIAALINKHSAIKCKEQGVAVRAGVEEFIGRVRNADEKELLSLNNELPWMTGIELTRLGRHIQKEHGSDLKGVGSIAQLRLKGDWAEVSLPTGLKGDKANLYIVLMKYPGGAYHAMETGWNDGSNIGRRIHNASLQHRGLINAVYSAFGWMHKCRISGGLSSTGYPRRIPSISIRSERDRLIVRGRNVLSRTHFHAELTPTLVWYWDDPWSLKLASSMKFERDGQKMVMAGGGLTFQNKDKTVVFTRSDGQVRMETGGKETLGSEFILDLETLAQIQTTNEGR